VGKLQLYGLVVATFLLGLVGIYSAGISRGQEKIRRKIDEKRLDNLQVHKDVDDEIDTLNDTSLADRASEWVRKD
jgi:hypothetical protein